MRLSLLDGFKSSNGGRGLVVEWKCVRVGCEFPNASAGYYGGTRRIDARCAGEKCWSFPGTLFSFVSSKSINLKWRADRSDTESCVVFFTHKRFFNNVSKHGEK